MEAAFTLSTDCCIQKLSCAGGVIFLTPSQFWSLARGLWGHSHAPLACRPLRSAGEKATVVRAFWQRCDDLWADANETPSGGQRRRMSGSKIVFDWAIDLLRIRSTSPSPLRLWQRGTAGGVCVGSNLISHYSAGSSRGPWHIIKSLMLAQCYRLLPPLSGLTT